MTCSECGTEMLFDEGTASTSTRVINWWCPCCGRRGLEVYEKQAGGEKKESRGEKINRLLKDKPECEWEPGGYR